MGNLEVKQTATPGLVEIRFARDLEPKVPEGPAENGRSTQDTRNL